MCHAKEIDMPSINMIAARRAEKRRRENNLKNIAYAIIVEIGIVLLCLSYLSIRYAAITARISELNGQIQKLQPKVSKIQKLQNLTARLMPKVQTLDGAKSDTLFWYGNITSISRCLPNKTWLTSMGTQPPVMGTVISPGAVSGPDPIISIAGVATSHSSVGEIMMRMNTLPNLDHVELTSDQMQKAGKNDVVNFQMTIHLKPQPGLGGQNATKS
jgi:Tfp pilus assembly protein PilN